MAMRLGELLVKHGAITPAQLDELLREQAHRREPLGVLAEELFGVEPRVLERCWAEQYASITARIDPRSEPVDQTVVATMSARQAWQFRLLPVRYDGREVMVCTCEQHLPRALRFAYRHFGPACWIVLADPGALYEALQHHYPMSITRDEWLAAA